MALRRAHAAGGALPLDGWGAAPEASVESRESSSIATRLADCRVSAGSWVLRVSVRLPCRVRWSDVFSKLYDHLLTFPS